MLTRFHKILIGLLVVQLGLIAVTALRRGGAAPEKPHPLLAGFDAAKVTRLQLFGPDAKKIELAKHGTSWVLASSFDYPVDTSKVDAVLSPIAKMAAAEPIATKATRHKQLKVDDTEFERKLVITMDGKDTTLYLGTSAGARRTAVRLGGDARVWGVTGVSAFAAGTEPTAWVDPGYLKVPADDIAKVDVQRGATTIELAHPAPPAAAGSGGAGGGSAGSGSAAPPPASTAWTASVDGAPLALAKGESLDTSAITKIVGDLSSIELRSPGDPKRDASHPTATITIERKAAGASSPAAVVLDVIADGDSYWVHQHGLDRAAMVPASRLDDVVKVERDKLVTKPAPPAKDEAKPGKDAAKPATSPAPAAAAKPAATAKPAAAAKPVTATKPPAAKPAPATTAKTAPPAKG